MPSPFKPTLSVGDTSYMFQHAGLLAALAKAGFTVVAKDVRHVALPPTAPRLSKPPSESKLESYEFTRGVPQRALIDLVARHLRIIQAPRVERKGAYLEVRLSPRKSAFLFLQKVGGRNLVRTLMVFRVRLDLRALGERRKARRD